MDPVKYLVSFCVFAVLNGGFIFGQDVSIAEAVAFQVKSTRRYTLNKENGTFKETQVVMIVGPEIDFEFTFGDRNIDVYGGKFPRDIESLQKQAAPYVGDQLTALDLVNQNFVFEVERLVESVLAKNNGRPTSLSSPLLLTKIKMLHRKKSLAIDNVWLPYQHVIRDQISFKHHFDHSPLSTILDVSDELKLSPDQIKLIERIGSELRKSLIDESKNNKDTVDDERRKMKKKIADLLESEQKGRFESLFDKR